MNYGLSELRVIWTQGRFQDFFQGWQRYLQGVAKISQGVAEKLRTIPFLSAFFAFLHNITNLLPLFLHKEIDQIFKFFLIVFILMRIFESSIKIWGNMRVVDENMGVVHENMGSSMRI